MVLLMTTGFASDGTYAHSPYDGLEISKPIRLNAGVTTAEPTQSWSCLGHRLDDKLNSHFL